MSVLDKARAIAYYGAQIAADWLEQRHRRNVERYAAKADPGWRRLPSGAGVTTRHLPPPHWGYRPGPEAAAPSKTPRPPAGPGGGS